jgi:tRNA (guanosine-2'-O-)-methyltransferase
MDAQDIKPETFLTPERLARLQAVAGTRQMDVSLVCESVHDPHNVSAILRSCDAFGVPRVELIGQSEQFRGHAKSSASARDWVELRTWEDTAECFAQLHEEEKTIYVSVLNPEAVDFYSLDLTKPCAIVLGNEHSGASEEAVRLGDQAVYIPMTGMVQSLNVSVAGAVMLSELFRQRTEAGMYEPMMNHHQEELYERWLEREMENIFRQ